MNNVAAVDEVMEARRVLSDVEFYGDVQVILACQTIERHVFSHEADGARALRAALEHQIAHPDGVDYVRLAAAVDILTETPVASQLVYLKQLCISRGIWTLPEDEKVYQPVWFEVTVFGVTAMGDEPDVLPHNWLLAARRVLAARRCEASKYTSNVTDSLNLLQDAHRCEASK